MVDAKGTLVNAMDVRNGIHMETFVTFRAAIPATIVSVTEMATARPAA